MGSETQGDSVTVMGMLEGQMTQYTVTDIMRLDPCYTENEVKALWAGREGLTIEEILALDIPATDRLWAAWRLLPDGPRQAALTATVTRAIETHALHCTVPAVKAWAARWLSGADRSRADAAAAAAAAAADAAAYAAYAYADAAERERQIQDILNVIKA